MKQMAVLVHVDTVKEYRTPTSLPNHGPEEKEQDSREGLDTAQ